MMGFTSANLEFGSQVGIEYAQSELCGTGLQGEQNSAIL
jgi:hypothetical protein